MLWKGTEAPATLNSWNLKISDYCYLLALGKLMGDTLFLRVLEDCASQNPFRD
jgi:hypothetical protein